MSEDLYANVMMTEAPDTRPRSTIADASSNSGGVWSRPGLSVRDRRIVTIVCVSAAVDVPAMDAHVYAALASGDLTVEQLNEFTLHFAVYCGWPRASQLEVSVRAQWQRLHEERGEPVPRSLHAPSTTSASPTRPSGSQAGMRCFEEINLIQSPPPDSPYFYAGILNFVFGHLWLRPGLTRRDRRLITIPCVGVGDAFGPIWSHVTSALGSGDVSLRTRWKN